MSNTILAPFIKWGNYKSQDLRNPDVLELQVVEMDTFETPYSINLRVREREGDDWNDKILPLKSHDSANDILLKEWYKAVKGKQARVGRRFLLKSYLGRTKKENKQLRRSWLEFL